MKYCAEYVWLDNASNFRSKVMILENDDKFNVDNYPIWNFDGSSCGFAEVNDSEVYLEPVKVYPNHFHKKDIDVIVYCSIFKLNGDEKIYYDSRNIFNHEFANNPMFGLEQEFYLIDSSTKLPYGYEKPGFISSFFTSKNNYCNVGDVKIEVRRFMNNVMEICLDMGILLTGYNYEVGPSQCEFQVCNYGINACDDLMMLRFVMERESEDFPFYVNYEPKPFSNLPGSGCHINFSTNETRGENGLDYINTIIDKMSKNHGLNLYYYGKDNKNRLTGYNETSDYKHFTFGIGSRNTSVRIPTNTYKNKFGYFEDRRPGANINPYSACNYLYKFSL
jgi:glutamine synthetase